jgi:hypothetical protein
MSKENVKGYYFVTTNANTKTAQEFCKKHKLFISNG